MRNKKNTFISRRSEPCHNSHVLLRPPLPRPSHSTTPIGAQNNCTSAFSAPQTTRTGGGPAGRLPEESTPHPSRIHVLPAAWRNKKAPHLRTQAYHTAPPPRIRQQRSKHAHAPASAVLPMRLFCYLDAIPGRLFVATQKNRALQPGMAGRRSGDKRNSWGILIRYEDSMHVAHTAKSRPGRIM